MKLVKKYRVSIYLSSGKVIRILCSEFTITKLSSSKTRELHWKIVRGEELLTIDVDTIVAVTRKFAGFYIQI